MKDRTFGIFVRATAVLAIFGAWLAVSRLLATWMSNHLALINGPIQAEYTDECTPARNLYGDLLEQSPPSCEPTGYMYGSGTYPQQDPGMPTSSFFGEVYTDGWGFVITHVLGVIVLVLAAVIIALLFLLFDGIINGFGSSHGDPCDRGRCRCTCSCCHRRKRHYEASRQSSSNTAMGVALGAAIGMSIGS